MSATLHGRDDQVCKRAASSRQWLSSTHQGSSASRSPALRAKGSFEKKAAEIDSGVSRMLRDLYADALRRLREPETGQICLIRIQSVMSVLIGGTENGASFSYTPVLGRFVFGNPENGLRSLMTPGCDLPVDVIRGDIERRNQKQRDDG